MLTINPSKTLFIAHHQKPNGCPDGMGALISAYLKYPDALFGGLDNQCKEQETLEYIQSFGRLSTIFFMDIMPDMNVLRSLRKQGIQINILDHHQRIINLYR